MLDTTTVERVKAVCEKHNEDPTPWIEMLEAGKELTDSYVLDKKGNFVGYSKEAHQKTLDGFEKCKAQYGEALFRLMGKDLQWLDRMGELNKRSRKLSS
jgi:hypothetical protein